MDGLRKMFANCCICGGRFENTDGAPETCGASKCQEQFDKLFEEYEEEFGNDRK